MYAEDMYLFYHFDVYFLCFSKINYYYNKSCDSVYMLRRIRKMDEFTYSTTAMTYNFRLGTCN